MPPKRRRRRRRTDAELTFWAIVIIAHIILGIYIIYTLSLGQVDLTPDSPKGESLEEKKNKAEQEHKRILAKLSAQKELKRKLEKRFRKVYLIARIIFAAMLAGYNVFLYFICKIQELGALINWNELLLIGFVAVNFVCYGSLANFNSLIRYFKNRIENRVYRDHAGLNGKIKQNKIEADKIKKEIADKLPFA